VEHRVYDPNADLGVIHRRLPHWFQPGSYHFITFRTADSLPRAVHEAWREERDRWLWSRGIDADAVNWERQLATLPAADRQVFRQRFSALPQQLLDEGHGACLLRKPCLRAIVVDSLKHFDGERYTLEAFVIMPNHVHVLAGLGLGGCLLRDCRSWKKFSARKINAALGRRGPFWQSESWDHLVRSVESFERIRRYIAENPGKAGLREAEYTAYVRGGAEE
jgi:REP element-mobilizing transposase RayT